MDDRLTAARAQADRQRALVQDTIIEVVLPDARRFLEGNDETDAWALLGVKLMQQLEGRPRFLAEILAQLAIMVAKGAREGPS